MVCYNGGGNTKIKPELKEDRALTIGRTRNEMEALIALNTATRNVLLAWLAYSRGSVDYKVIVLMKTVFKKTVNAILKNTDSTVRPKVAEIAEQILKEFGIEEE